ncbi:MAG: hypothetical protein Tsb007_37120 [Rhizobacter sp.]
MPRITHHKSLTTESGFRLIRTLTLDHNTLRFLKHCERIKRRPDNVRWHKKWKTRLDRRVRRSERAGTTA